MANLSGKTGFSAVQTRISLANNTTTTVQNFSAYDGIRLSGFVYVDATVDKRATVEVWVVKNGAGTYEVAAADVAGDDLSGSPIVTFSMSGTNLIATLPNFTGFVSAYIQYHLSAPQLGATFPLTVDGSNVTLANPTTQGVVRPRKGQFQATVTSGQAGWSTRRASVIYYQDQDGNHRLKFNINGSFTSATVSSITATVSGVTFKNLSGFYQPVSAMISGAGTSPALIGCYAAPNSSNIAISAVSAAANMDTLSVSGDVELESKPSWA